MLKYSIFLMLFVVLAYTANVHAILLAHEPFDYDAGFIHDQLGNGGADGAMGGTGWSGGWKNNVAIVSDGSLTAPAGYGFTPTGGKLDHPPVGGGGANRNPERQLGFNIPMNPAVQTNYWVSVLAKRMDDDNVAWSENFWPMEIRPSSNANHYQAGWGTVNDGTDISSIPAENRQEMVVAKAAGSYVNQAPIEIMNIGSSYLLLVNIVANPAGTPNEVRVKTYEAGVDTVSGIPTTWDAIASSDRGDVLVEYTLNWGAQTPIMADEIRIGTTMADVVPEPATLSLLGLGALAAIRRRKR